MSSKEVAVLRQETELVKRKDEEFEILAPKLQNLIDSKNLPAHIKTVEQAYMVAMMGKELGFPLMQAFNYILPIQGKLTLSAKALAALLRKGGVKYQTVNDGAKVYGNGTTIPKNDEDKAVDLITTIRFIRDEMEEIVNFYWSDAVKMGLTTKENWVKMPKFMLWARCISAGANRVAADMTMGLYTTEEIYDHTPGVQVKRNEEGEIIEILD